MPSSRLHFSPFHSLFYWLTSMKYQNEQDKNRRRPLTPASRFFWVVFFGLYWTSILLKSQGEWQPNETDQKPPRHKYSREHRQRYKRCRVCVGEWSYMNGEEKSGVIEEISGSDGSGKEQYGWMKRQEMDWQEDSGWKVEREERRYRRRRRDEEAERNVKARCSRWGKGGKKCMVKHTDIFAPLLILLTPNNQTGIPDPKAQGGDKTLNVKYWRGTFSAS